MFFFYKWWNSDKNTKNLSLVEKNYISLKSKCIFHEKYENNFEMNLKVAIWLVVCSSCNCYPLIEGSVKQNNCTVNTADISWKLKLLSVINYIIIFVLKRSNEIGMRDYKLFSQVCDYKDKYHKETHTVNLGKKCWIWNK